MFNFQNICFQIENFLFSQHFFVKQIVHLQTKKEFHYIQQTKN